MCVRARAGEGVGTLTFPLVFSIEQTFFEVTLFSDLTSVAGRTESPIARVSLPLASDTPTGSRYVS